jgi:DNA-binding MarR family transcriptional regulator
MPKRRKRLVSDEKIGRVRAAFAGIAKFRFNRGKLSLLIYLYGADPDRFNYHAFAIEFDLGNATVCRDVDDLVALNFVCRVPHRDTRRRPIALTETGEQWVENFLVPLWPDG